MVVAGDENGNIYVWKDVESIKEHIGLNMTGHTSAIQRIELTKDDKRMISVGATDNTMLQWRLNSIE